MLPLGSLTRVGGAAPLPGGPGTESVSSHFFPSWGQLHRRPMPFLSIFRGLQTLFSTSPLCPPFQINSGMEISYKPSLWFWVTWRRREFYPKKGIWSSTLALITTPYHQHNPPESVDPTTSAPRPGLTAYTGVHWDWVNSLCCSSQTQGHVPREMVAGFTFTFQQYFQPGVPINM